MAMAGLFIGILGISAVQAAEPLPELTLDKNFYYVRSAEQDKSDWLKSSDVSLWFTQDSKPVYSFETIQPFGKVDSKGQLRFWQGRYAYNSETEGTANLGLGWRKLSADKSSIVGFNAFYDHAFEYNLSRVGLGTEYFHGLGEYRANVYLPISGEKNTGKTDAADNILYIRAVKGLDYEAGTALTKAPWLSVYASGFYYDNKYSKDEQGYKLRSNLQITPRLALEGGYIHSNVDKGDWYGKVMFQLADGFKPSLRGNRHDNADKKEYARDLTYKLLQKVERDNTIKTETYAKSAATAAQTVTIVNNDESVITVSPTGTVAYNASTMNVTVGLASSYSVVIYVNSINSGIVIDFGDSAQTINLKDIDPSIQPGDTVTISAAIL